MRKYKKNNIYIYQKKSKKIIGARKELLECQKNAKIG
jgi:hypothetical protein